MCTVGAAFLAAAGGDGAGRGSYYEVEVLEAQGQLYVGLAGTSFGPQCQYAGADACSWGFCANSSSVYAVHRSRATTDSDGHDSD